MAGELRLPGQPAQSGNPLKALTDALDRLQPVIEGIERNTRPDASAVLPHRYGLSIAHDPGQGKVWGAFCLACSSEASEYVWPCRLDPDEALKPPNFFSVGDVYIPDDSGRLRKYVDPSPSSN